jgi:hypothetical protein
LTSSQDRNKYLRQVETAVRPQGFVLVATFGLDGPAKCSGLEVRRYSIEMLVEQFGKAFTLLASRHEVHRTPSGNVQSFNYVLMRNNSARRHMVIRSHVPEIP